MTTFVAFVSSSLSLFEDHVRSRIAVEDHSRFARRVATLFSIQRSSPVPASLDHLAALVKSRGPTPTAIDIYGSMHARGLGKSIGLASPSFGLQKHCG